MHEGGAPAALAIACVLLSGCFAAKAIQAYPGPERSPGEIATITAWDHPTWADLQGIIYIVKVDGVKVGGTKWDWDRVGQVTVEPGVHVVHVFFRRGYFESAYLVPIRIAAAPGGLYEIHGKEVRRGPVATNEEDLKVWVINRRTGEDVTAEKGLVQQ